MDNIQHKNVSPAQRHAPHSWVVADATARAALSVVSDDVGKYCLQQDDNSQWMLTDESPATWQELGAGGEVLWSDIAGKPAVIAAGADAAAARSAIGAGTSSFSGAYGDLSGKPTLGTGAALNVAATGNAAAGELVKGNDTRLSGGGGGIPDAPSDGNIYGRKDASWEEVPAGGDYPAAVFGPAPVHEQIGAGAVALESWLNASSDNRDLFLDLCHSTYGLGFCAASPHTAPAFFGSAAANELLISDLPSLQQLATNAAMFENWMKFSPLTRISVPTMTGLTTPSGVASASSTYSTPGYEAWRAFDKTAAQWCPVASGGLPNQWVQYSFPSPVFINLFGISPHGDGSRPHTLRAEYSDDGSSWTSAGTFDISNATLFPSGVMRRFQIAAAGRHTHWRMFALTSVGYCEVAELIFDGFA